MARIQLSGGAYSARSVIASAQRQVNLYGEGLPTSNQYSNTTGIGEPSQFAYYPTAGLRRLLTLPTGPVRGGKRCTNGNVYAVGGRTLYRIGADWTATAVGDITDGPKTPVSMADNGNTLMIVDGTPFGYTVDLASGAFAQLNDPTGTFSGADRVDYLDTYFIFNKPGTPQFYISGSLDTTFDPLDFANKESYSDILVAAAVAKRQIWLIGSQTTEVWANVGAGGTLSDPDITSFTFQSQSGVFIDHGAVAKYSIAVTDNDVYWLTQNRDGAGSVVRGIDYQMKPISTPAMTAEFATYPRLDDAIAWTHRLAGHYFYTIAFPHADKTWSYDILTGQWHEAVWLDINGTEHRHRANCAFTGHGQVLCGDWENGNIYAYDLGVYTDDGQPIKRLRHFPHMLNDGKRVFHRQVLMDIETGIGGHRVPEEPQIFLAWSDDRGHLFGNPVGQDFGATGEYLTSLQWQRLGLARDRVYQVEWSSPYKTALQGLWLDVTPAAS